MSTAEILIKENNEKRKELSDENLDYYEDMLVYIRLSFSKSEIATEEVLSELLNHLLDAQENGKTAYEVFGNNPKGYVEEIIGELPKKIPNNFLKYFFMGVLFFFGVKQFFEGIVNLILYYGFSKGSLEETIYVGTMLINVIILLPIAFALIYLLILIIRWSTFKKLHSVLEFLIYWIWSIISFGIFFVIIYFMPDFGPELQTLIWMPIAFGSILLLFGWYVFKKI